MADGRDRKTTPLLGLMYYSEGTLGQPLVVTMNEYQGLDLHRPYFCRGILQFPNQRLGYYLMALSE